MRDGSYRWLISTTALASVLLASIEARAQNIGPGLFTSTVNMGASMTVLGSTQWTPPAGSVAANVAGPGTLTFDPTAGSAPGPITVDTVNAAAIVITGSGQFVINPGGSSFPTTITTTGPNAYAIDVVSGQHTESLNNVVIITSGTNSDGIRIENPNNIINATNATVTTTGAGASALALISGGGSTANFTGSGLTSAAGPVIRVQGGSGKTINLIGTSVTAGSGDGRWLYITGGATNTNITASGSPLIGIAITDSGSTSNLTLTNGTLWNMTGSSNVTNLTNSASTIEFAPPVGGAFKTLTTVNYTGAGGTLGLNTFLGADNSPSDKLVINGGTGTGTSLLRITNAGGPGAETTGDGIQVVQAINATTTPGAFTLGGAEVRTGAFDYFLFRGGINGSDPNSWFLRSNFIVPPIPPGPEPPGPVPPGPGPEVFPPEPPPGVLPPGLYPIIGPELATYGVVQPIARELGLATLSTLHERIGDTLASDPCQAAPVADSGRAIYRKAPAAPTGCTPSGWAPSVWARGFGQQVSDHYRAFADPRADGSIAGIQSGFDLWRGALSPWGHDVAGLFFAYSNASIDVNGLVTNPTATGYVLNKTGTLNLNAWSGGAYWTHYGPGGWYLDLVLQGTDYAGGAQTQFAKLTTDGWGFISSAEAGYPIPVYWLGPGFVLEPQAQVVWQQVSFNRGNDGLGDVALGTTSGTTGRVGVRGKWTILAWYEQVWEPYVRVNLWQDWGAQATTMFGIDAVPLLERATRLETAAGLTARLTTSWSLYAQGGYQFALNGTDGGRRDGVKGDLGLRYTW